MEYELVEDRPEERCALVARRDGGIESAPLPGLAPPPVASLARRPWPLDTPPQMGEG